MTQDAGCTYEGTTIRSIEYAHGGRYKAWFCCTVVVLAVIKVSSCQESKKRAFAFTSRLEDEGQIRMKERLDQRTLDEEKEKGSAYTVVLLALRDSSILPFFIRPCHGLTIDRMGRKWKDLSRCPTRQSFFDLKGQLSGCKSVLASL